MLKITTTEVQALPGSAQAIIGIIGLPDAIEFIRAFGGAKLYTPRNFAKQQAMFAAVIGEAKAEKLCQAHVGVGSWHVPRCLKLINAERGRQIRADYDSGKFTRNELTLKYRLSHSRIDDILKAASGESLRI